MTTPTSDEAWTEYLETRRSRSTLVVLSSVVSALVFWPLHVARLTVAAVRWLLGL